VRSASELVAGGAGRVLRGNMLMAKKRTHPVKGVPLTEFNDPNEYAILTEKAQSMKTKSS
jgi:hypothetical protein